MASETIPPGEALIARSEASRRVLALAERVARVSPPVLLTGESGSGKERIARFIHARSSRAAGPFVPVDPRARPDQLLQCRVFRHVQIRLSRAHRGPQRLLADRPDA